MMRMSNRPQGQAMPLCGPGPSLPQAPRLTMGHSAGPHPSKALGSGSRGAGSSVRPTQRAPTARRMAQQQQGPSDSGSNSEQPDVDGLRKKFFPGASPDAAEAEPSATGDAEQGPDFLDAVNPISLGRQARKLVDEQGVPVDNVNPIALGRQARRAFNEVWTQLSQLASPTKRTAFEDEFELDNLREQTPAQASTVLVLGATGQVGRILVRKLLLRGYKVRALVRRKPGRGEGGANPETGEVVEGIPAAVKVVFGDVGDMRDCQEAVRGADKVIYCAAARSTFTGDLNRVEEAGVRNMVKAFQDECIRRGDHRRAKGPGSKRRLYTEKSKKEIADFSQPYHQARWNITFIGVTEEEAASQSERSREMGKFNQAVAEINDEDNLVFEGVLYQRAAAAEVGADVAVLMPGGEHRTALTEGLVLRLRGDGKQYACVVKMDDGKRFSARFPTRPGYTHVRLPWDLFRPESEGAGTLQPERITYMGLRYEFRRSAGRLGGGRGMPTPEELEEMKKERQFQLEVDWIKALPGGQEPDFILVSRAGKLLAPQPVAEPEQQPAPALAGMAAGSSASFGSAASASAAPVAGASQEAIKKLEFKRRGEELLRQSGLGYTIIRPGTLVEEPGGYKAIVFDQGDRITESIAAADVADICLRALYEPAARNKTFDVCYEAQTEAGNEMYELVAHVPDRTNSYLKSAVTGLVKNT